MRIEKRVKLENNIYYVIVDVEYKINKQGITMLYLKKYNDDYYDGGDFSRLIEKIENNYSNKKALEYDSRIGLMADVLYIYDRIPFLSGVKDVFIGANTSIPSSISYISKEEIDGYIKIHNLKMKFNSNFKLCDERTWKI